MRDSRWRVCRIDGKPHFWCLRHVFGCAIDVTVWRPGSATARGVVSAIGWEAGDILEHARIGSTLRVRLNHSRTITGHDGAEVLLMVTDRIRPVGSARPC